MRQIRIIGKPNRFMSEALTFDFEALYLSVRSFESSEEFILLPVYTRQIFPKSL
jgi:hypothetical protein